MTKAVPSSSFRRARKQPSRGACGAAVGMPRRRQVGLCPAAMAAARPRTEVRERRSGRRRDESSWSRFWRRSRTPPSSSGNTSRVSVPTRDEVDAGGSLPDPRHLARSWSSDADATTSVNRESNSNSTRVCRSAADSEHQAGPRAGEKLDRVEMGPPGDDRRRRTGQQEVAAAKIWDQGGVGSATT